ncbi:hypothetical protein C1645_764362 [Glomus cerebriforme]|uniref:MARVEL domain-containing protein n=1 Tax=Glomus cerebriforme TaxID=658196 RepID=A0A397T8L1_9GLOM|nr:hypothetical protein C1645_764362 [Glomus cerebriforme]
MITKCCFCIPLRPGVALLSLLWLFGGVSVIVKFSLDLASPVKIKNMFTYSIICIIIFMITYGLTMIGAAFGLYVITCANEPKWMSIYSKIAYVILGIIIAGNIAAITVFVEYKSKILDSCYGNNTSNNCDQEYNNYLAIAIGSAIFSSILSVHFALVITAHSHKINDGV